MPMCPICGKRNPKSNKFCGECGTDLSIAEMYCPNCEKMHNDGENFCTECGTKLITKREYQTLTAARFHEMIRNREIKKLSESLDDDVFLLAGELYADYSWLNKSKDEILDDLLKQYNYSEIIIMSENLPKEGEKYNVYKLFGELNEESAQEFARIHLNICYAGRTTKEEIFSYMLNNVDMKQLRVKLMSFKKFHKQNNNTHKNNDTRLDKGLKRCPNCNAAIRKKVKKCPRCDYQFK